LLNKYAANQDKLKSFVFKSENVRTNFVTKDGTASYSKVKQDNVEFRYEDDGSNFRAYYHTKDVHSAADGSLVIADQYYNSSLWDQKRYYEYHKTPVLDASNVFVSSKVIYMKDAITRGYYGAGSILGFLYGDVERFDSILRQVDSISLRDELERVGSVDCYVIDAKTKHGTYTIWLDPEHGYGIAKAYVHRGPKDLRFGRPRSSFVVSTVEQSFFVENVRFENTEGIWVPMEADFKIDSKYLSTSKWPISAGTVDTHYKVTELLLDPDHDALGSFVPDIENGTSVRIQEAPGIRYTWDNEKKFVLDEWDNSIKYVPKDWSVLVGVGKPLPKFESIKLRLSAQQTKDRAILISFFDMNQRPSRHCIMRLARQAQQLKQKGVTVVVIQASKINENKLNEWVKKNNIPFPVGMIQGDVEKTHFTWGIRSLPWLILTDMEHIVRAEGFVLTELDEKISAITQK